MIKSIRLSNIQSHKDTFITFDEGVNVIVGITGSGKTAILRAFYWIVYNRPVNDDLMSHWAEECYAEIETAEGNTITRGRDKKGNYYRLKTEHIVQEYRAFKHEVPAEIQQALNISEINLAAQMDAPFLLSNSPGEVAQLLNKIVHLDVIDRAVSNVRKKKLHIDKELQFVEGEIATLNNQLTEYSYLKQMEKDVVVYEQLTESLFTIKEKITQLAKLVQQIKETQEELDKYDVIQQANPTLELALSLQNRKHAVEDRIVDLKRIVRDMKMKQKEAEQHKKEMNKLDKEYHRLMPAECPLCGRS